MKSAVWKFIKKLNINWLAVSEYTKTNCVILNYNSTYDWVSEALFVPKDIELNSYKTKN